jgi:4-hydroxy-3-methylbut-2-enyl diphosphate reductase
VPSLIFRKGLDRQQAVAAVLAESYHSALVDSIKAEDFTYRSGRLTVHLAREFGFCYGVDRAVDYAYQTRDRFPNRTVYLTGEIIHNPHVNDKLRSLGVKFLSDDHDSLARLDANDVVILPAFGVTVATLEQLTTRGCTLIDTTCGSVLNVWKNVRRYAEGGYTSIIHGKVWHEETQATIWSFSTMRRPRRSATTFAAAATRRHSSNVSTAPFQRGSIPIAISSTSVLRTRRRC